MKVVQHLKVGKGRLPQFLESALWRSLKSCIQKKAEIHWNMKASHIKPDGMSLQTWADHSLSLGMSHN